MNPVCYADLSLLWSLNLVFQVCGLAYHPSMDIVVSSDRSGTFKIWAATDEPGQADKDSTFRGT